MADFLPIPMKDTACDQFRAENNLVYYFEGDKYPSQIDNVGNPDDIFAFRKIGGGQVERLLFVKKLVKKGGNKILSWEEAKGDGTIRHRQFKSQWLVMNAGIPFWPTWHQLGRNHREAPRQRATFAYRFDQFFRLHANRQGWSAEEPIEIEDDSLVGLSAQEPIEID